MAYPIDVAQRGLRQTRPSLSRSRQRWSGAGYGASLGALSVLVGFLFAEGAYGSALAAQATRWSTIPWDSTPMIEVADVDFTVPPCHDFYQFAVNSWYRRTPATEVASVDVNKRLLMGIDRIEKVLRQFVVTAPELALTTTDPTTRLVGQFYGSCLADTTGVAAGAVGDGQRASYCFRVTHDSLMLALVTVLLERVWPAPARAQSRALWLNLVTAARERFRTSATLSDTAKRQLLARVNELDLKMSTGGGIPDIFVIPFLDSLTAGWDRVPVTRRGYGDITLSPTDFQQNLERLRNTTPPAIAPSLQKTLRHFLAMLFSPSPQQNVSKEGHVFIAPRKLIPPRVNGTVDLGGWYGIVAPLLGHEMGHRFDFFFNTREDEREVVAFAEEQLKGQLELRSRNGHPFDDQFGVLLAHDAFTRALEGSPRQRLEGFTPEQRFFLGVAQGLRGGEISGNTVANGVARWRIRTNGALSTIPAFATVFGCQASGPMTGGRVWYRDPWYGVALTQEQRQAVYRGFLVDQVTEVAMFIGFHAKFTEGQRTQAEHIEARHRGRWDVLRDSLMARPAMSYVPGYQQTVHLVAEQWGDYHALMTPEQRTLFDPQIQAWVRERARLGFEVAVPGIQP